VVLKVLQGLLAHLVLDSLLFLMILQVLGAQLVQVARWNLLARENLMIL